LFLGDVLQKGDYALQLLVKDNKKRGKDSLASQSLTFEISADK